MSDYLVKSCLGYEYDLKDALRHNPTIIQAGDDICAIALGRIEALEAENAALKDAAKNVHDLPPGVWEAWTSCSFRRITAQGGPDGGVLHATVHPSDGHPDLSWDERTCRALCNLVNELRAALEGKEKDDE